MAKRRQPRWVTVNCDELVDARDEGHLPDLVPNVAGVYLWKRKITAPTRCLSNDRQFRDWVSAQAKQRAAIVRPRALWHCMWVQGIQIGGGGLPDEKQNTLLRVSAHAQMRDYDGQFAPGTLIYFVPRGKTPADRHRKADRIVNDIAKNAYTMTLAVSLGNIRTLVEHPGSMTHSMIPPDEQMRRGIDPGGIRVSIGLEKPDDIIRDLTHALDRMGA